MLKTAPPARCSAEAPGRRARAPWPRTSAAAREQAPQSDGAASGPRAPAMASYQWPAARAVELRRCAGARVPPPRAHRVQVPRRSPLARARASGSLSMFCNPWRSLVAGASRLAPGQGCFCWPLAQARVFRKLQRFPACPRLSAGPPRYHEAAAAAPSEGQAPGGPG